METRKKVYLDANIFFAAGNPEETEHRAASEILLKIQEGELIGCTSSLTVDEVVYNAKKFTGREAAIASGLALVEDPLLEIIPVTRETAQKALRMMKEANLEPRDAIHVAAAIESKAVLFLSIDADLRKKSPITVKTPRELLKNL